MISPILSEPDTTEAQSDSARKASRTKPSGRLRELDFVRGVAILLVMSAHFVKPHTSSPIFEAYTHFSDTCGVYGVDVFFVLSGFLVGGLLVREFVERGSVDLTRFMIRRAWKIWPAYYAYLLLIFVTGHHAASTFLVANFLHLQNYLGTSLPQTWSLAVEEHFYLLLPLTIPLLLRGSSPLTRLLKVCITVSVLSLGVRVLTYYYLGQKAAHEHTEARLDSLFFGVFVAGLYYLDKPRFISIAKCRWQLLLVAAASFSLPATNPPLWLMPTIGYSVLYIGSGAILMLCYAHSGAIRNWAIYRFVSWIGLYSYGIYLWHDAVRATCLQLTAYFPGPTRFLASQVLQFAAALTLGITLSKAIEWPCLRLRERLAPARPTLPVSSGVTKQIRPEALVIAPVR